MKTIVFLGSNKSGTSRDALKAAKELGYYVVLITDRKKLLTQKSEFPEVDKMIYKENMFDAIGDIKKLIKKGKDIVACVSFIDPYVSLASKWQAELGLFELSSEALFLLEDKTRFRQALSDLPSSPFYKVYSGNEKLETTDRPLIIKPSASNGSKDVVLVNTYDELQRTLKSYRNKYPVLIEEYLQGPQYLVEVVVHKGKLHIIAIIQQEISNGDRFIVTGYQYPAVLEEVDKDNLTKEVTGIIERINLENGSCHLEMRLVDGSWKLIEINPRMSGGAMNRIILEGTGINVVKEIIQMNIGEKPNFKKSFNHAVYAKFLTIQSRGRLVKVTGRNRASRHKGVKEVYVKPKKGTVMTKPLSLGNRYAYVLATGKTPEEAKDIAVNAAKEIRFVIETL